MPIATLPAHWRMLTRMGAKNTRRKESPSTRAITSATVPTLIANRAAIPKAAMAQERGSDGGGDPKLR